MNQYKQTFQQRLMMGSKDESEDFKWLYFEWSQSRKVLKDYYKRMPFLLASIADANLFFFWHFAFIL